MPFGKNAARFLALLALVAALPGRAGAVTSRYAHSATLLPNGNVLIAGGIDSGGTPVATTEIYNVATGATNSSPNMTVARSSHTATLLPNGLVLIAGGVDNAGAVKNSLELYDPRANTFTSIPATLSSARYNHTATLLADGTVLLAGGQNPVVGGAALSSCDIYVPSPTGGNGSVTACNSMGRARAGHSATLLHTGRVFVSGGYDPSTGGYIVSTEIYDPTATSWSPGPALIAQRAYHSSTQMANKTVLITGGNNGRNVAENYGFLNTTEIYNPFANSIAPGAAMQARKMFHTAVQGPNGPLEVDGGLGNITTSYFTPSLAFQNNSIITIGAPTVAPATGTVTGTGNLTVNLTFNLSVPVTGDIIQGTVQFSSASATEPDLVVYFKSAQASINGAFANSGQIQNETVNVTATPGQSLVLGTTVAITADDTATSVTAGSIATSNIHFPNAANANDPNSGTDGTMDANNGDAPRVIETARSNVRASAVFPLPAAEYQGLAGTVLVGQATIQSGTILLTGGANSTGYTITLTGGLASLTGNCTISTINNTPAMRCSNLNFANLTGNIAVTSGTITSPLTSDPAATTKCPATPTVGSPTSCLSGLQITGLTPQLLYVPSTVNLSNLTFATDIATVAIKTMAFGDAERYDESANSFTFGDPSVSGQFQHAAVLLPNGDKILSGGRTCTTGSPTCASLSPITGFVTLPVPSTDPSWSSQGSLNQPRANHTLTVLQDGHALAAGGTTATGVLSSSELYDPATKKWAFAGAMTTSRNLHTATLLTNGTVLAAGGFATLASTSELNSAEIYIPESQRWSPVGLMTSSRTFHSAVLMSTGNVLVTGGFGNNQYLSSAEIYVSTALRWMSAGSMSKARALHTSTVLQDGRVLVVGGVNLADGVLNSVDIYSPARNLWLPAAALNFARHSHTATLLPDGRVLVAGGDDGFGEIGEAEIYNPKTNAWTALPITTDGRNILVPRLKHTALLLPNGKVEIVGGVTAVGAAIDETENFDAAFSTWTYQGRSNAKRGFHTSALLHDGNMINAGGFDGTSYLSNSEDQSFQYGLDVPGPSSRVPQIVAFDTGTVQNSAISGGNNALTISGNRLKGVTDAAGGASASGNSDYHHPRIYLQRLDGSGGNGQSASSYVLDVTTLAYYSGGNSWTNEDSSITVILPNSDGLLPFGLYAVRVAANAQFSDAAVLQVGPKRPAGQPGVPQGTLVGSSSVTWTWTASSGNDFDGYSVYSATSGVFLGTAPARDNNGNLLASTSFIVQGLGTNSVSLIKVAPYNVSGDGPVSIATGAVNTIAADISGLTGTGASPTSINWSWNVVNGATGYNVFSASSGTLLAALGSAGFTETNLSTNTAYGIAVQAITGAGLGPLSANTTAFTLAAVPTVDPNTAMVNIQSTSFLAQWGSNTNPPTTVYSVRVFVQGDLSTTHQVNGITTTSTTVSGLSPNIVYVASVTAFNGDGIANPPGFVNLGSTATFANTPTNAQVIGVTPNSLTINWSPNGNSGATIYQVVQSADDFVTVSTPIQFTSNFTSTQTVVSGLLTGVTYKFRISARNVFGNETSFAVPVASGTTNNGGGPAGSLSACTVANSTYNVILQGNLGDLTPITLFVPAGSFSQDVCVFVSSRAAANVCGGLHKLSITTTPSGAQPQKPLQLTVGYNSGDPTGPTETFGLTRFDPTSGSCVPSVSSVDSSQLSVTSYINHFSEFQLQQISPSGTIETGRVFPNPLFASQAPFFTFDRLPANASVKIYTIHGETLFDGSANASGVAIWPATNKHGRHVASGLYLAIVNAGGEKRIFKLAVVR